MNSLLLFFSVVATGAWGDVGFDFRAPSFKGGNAVLAVFVKNTVTTDDYAQVAKWASYMQPSFGDQWAVIAKLDSRGGNVTAALKIGRFLRNKGAMAVVEKDAVCLSACVYILAGATNRAVDGRVGIHRPYEPNDQEISEIGQKAKYKALEKDILAFLHEMNIPTRLYEDSLFISPDRVKILTFKELQGYGLNENDPYADEASTVKRAKQLGITRAEYAAREVRSRRQCGLNAMTIETSENELVLGMECRAAILEGTR
ncbi:hypothetical protein [Nitrosovibrio sp. Nv6]|uniref:COG3904 family protein n=1 Tax=Nitrosovibrio sp. Nv6 TaxID=1855340 RepID=UPI0008C1EAD8|nr:hypothetical protein [Nitrosovibrio sp. Nv6]SEP00655.1 hypothetical protein SAMN05216316_1441 [Nitrosovibrio sp. Nv6]